MYSKLNKIYMEIIMESLIRYVATECRYEIESYTQYVKDICSRLERNDKLYVVRAFMHEEGSAAS